MSFQENLKHYREKAGYKSAKEFADVLDIPYTSYVAYENKGREPKYEMLCKISDLLKVSTDELLGRTSNILGTKDEYFLLKKLNALLDIANKQHSTDIEIQKVDNENIYFKNNKSTIKLEYAVNKNQLVSALKKIDEIHQSEAANILSIFLSNTNTENILSRLSNKLIEASSIADYNERVKKIKEISNAINIMKQFRINSNIEKDFFDISKNK